MNEPAQQKPKPLNGVHVLHVDDDRLVRIVAAAMLSRLGARAISAADGHAAIAALDQPEARIDVVLLDVVMPGFDGLATLHEIRRRRPTIPVVLCSGTGVDLARLDPSLGSPIVLEKPFILSTLEKALESALR